MTKATVLETPKGWILHKSAESEGEGLYIVLAGEYHLKSGRQYCQDQPKIVKMY